MSKLWRTTEREVHADAPPSRVRWFAEVRRLILDEFAARDPERFASWLAGGPVTDPRTHLTRRR